MSDTHGEALHPEHLATDGRHDVTLIRQVVADADRFQNDAGAFSGLLAPDVVLVNVAGTRLMGRESVRRTMEAALRTPLAGVVTRNVVEDITFLRPDVAVVSGVKIVFARAGDTLDDAVTESFRARLTMVLTKQGDEWRIAVVQNTPIQGTTADAASASRAAARDAAQGGEPGARLVELPGGVGILPRGDPPLTR